MSDDLHIFINNNYKRAKNLHLKEKYCIFAGKITITQKQ